MEEDPGKDNVFGWGGDGGGGGRGARPKLIDHGDEGGRGVRMVEDELEKGIILWDGVKEEEEVEGPKG